MNLHLLAAKTRALHVYATPNSSPDLSAAEPWLTLLPDCDEVVREVGASAGQSGSGRLDHAGLQKEVQDWIFYDRP